jgi:ribulose-phosphate 3-epimerase
MIVEPERWVDDFAAAGADTVIVHVEACRHLDRTVGRIHELGRRAGVALNPATPLVALEEILPALDLVLVMTVNPGFGGQRFVATMLDKLRRARAALDARNPAGELEVDGGIDAATIGPAAAAGATVFVAGTSVFRHPAGPAAGIRALVAAAGG